MLTKEVEKMFTRQISEAERKGILFGLAIMACCWGRISVKEAEERFGLISLIEKEFSIEIKDRLGYLLEI